VTRTVFLGTSDFAAAILTRLAGSPHRPQLVVTRPDRPAGRGRRLASPPVADAARTLDLALAQPERVNDEDARAQIAAAAPDAVIVCAFGALIREPLLSDFAMLNVHPSLLPRWRGAAPVERAIMAGDPETGVCIMRLTAGLDSGPVCLTGREPIAVHDTYGTLTPRLQELGAALLLRVLDERPQCAEQLEEGVTYAEKIGPADRTLDPAATAAVNDRVVRGLTPHIGARVELAGGGLLGVLRATVREPNAAGELRADGDRLLLGGLELLEVQPAGGRPMGAAAYLRGRARS
jgi:methionyl-tRNA formyltransferase